MEKTNSDNEIQPEASVEDDLDREFEGETLGRRQEDACVEEVCEVCGG